MNSTEVAVVLLTQQPLVQFSAFSKMYDFLIGVSLIVRRHVFASNSNLILTILL